MTSPPRSLLAHPEHAPARAFCVSREVPGRCTPTCGVPRPGPCHASSAGLAWSPQVTCRRSRRPAASPGGRCQARAPPAGRPRAPPVSGAQARRRAGGAAPRAAAALGPPLSVSPFARARRVPLPPPTGRRRGGAGLRCRGAAGTAPGARRGAGPGARRPVWPRLPLRPGGTPGPLGRRADGPATAPAPRAPAASPTGHPSATAARGPPPWGTGLQGVRCRADRPGAVAAWTDTHP